MEMTTHPITHMPMSGSSYDDWNLDKTRRMNLWDSKRFPKNQCPHCNGSGWIWKDWGESEWIPCSCQSRIQTRKHTENAGLSKSLAKFNLNDFRADQAWQTALLKCTCDYARHPKGFLFICGQPGAGKTHLAAGAFNYILKGGARGKGRSWPDLMAELKAAQNTPDYVRLMDELKGCQILYLDDFLHAVKKQPTTGDLKLAFEIINARYDNDRNPTIITSNLTPSEIAKFDSSLSGRIVEAAGAHMLIIAPDPDRDYRTRKGVEV